MKASAIIANYNHANYLPECLDALLSQTHPFDEIIIFDDGSTDSSVQVIKNYAEKNPQIIFRQNEKNIGVCETYNQMIALAKGDYVAVCASDDFISPYFLEKTIHLAKQHPDLGLITCDINKFTDVKPYQFTMVAGIENCKDVQIFTPGDNLHKELRQNNFVFSWACLYRREYLTKYGYNKILASLSDFYLNTQISLRYPIAYIPEALGNVRINTTQGSYYSHTYSGGGR